MVYTNPAHASGHTVRTMSLADYTATRPQNPMFPATSNTVAKVVMILLSVMIAAGLVFVIVETALVG